MDILLNLHTRGVPHGPHLSLSSDSIFRVPQVKGIGTEWQFIRGETESWIRSFDVIHRHTVSNWASEE